LNLSHLHTFTLFGTWPAPFRWWAALCAVTVVNLGAWVGAAWAFRRRSRTTDSPAAESRRWQPWLSAVFVLICGFRAVFPRADVQRICLHDSWLSSVAVGRSLATVAELCFIAQWAFLLRELGTSTKTRFAVAISWLLVPLICVAEACSWYAVLTTRYAGNAFEESIWALSATLAIAGALAVWPRIDRRHRPQLALAIVFGIAYVGFMAGVDVPMYVSRWLADEAHGRRYLSLDQGVRDVLLRWVVTDSWEEWRSEMPWMSLYFSVAVWFSIALMHAPRFGPSREPDRARRSQLRLRRISYDRAPSTTAPAP
jgi:cytochrome bd-type quinol oxidase subunit 2